MELIADILLVAGAIGAGCYCYVLARRLSRFNDLENGVGGAVAMLSAQVDDLSRMLDSAKGTAEDSTQSLEELTGRAESVAKHLELMVASLHDLPEPPAVQKDSKIDTPPEMPAGPVFKRNREMQPGMKQ